MYEYVDSNSDRVGSFKRALYNLDCFQISGVAYNYILDCGFVESPTGNLLENGRLGFIQCWEIRPIKPALFALVNTSSKLGFPQKRKTKLRNLYTLSYNEDKDKTLQGVSEYEHPWSWNVIVSEYLLARQSHRDSLSGTIIAPPSPYYPEDIDVINILLSVSNCSLDSYRQVQNKRRKLNQIDLGLV